ncbi:oligopeptide ABC transporter substrate-binding protein [Granulicatella elegans]|uniref:oligopeptide ABC transporter substrate-binding protein n=1 Tax=Granulicatella elegans TaxID=137732 RepID=UPI001D1434D0|nr:oligopeptide ABC transporter substrate-binding protein [Granulicatella elegans]UEA31486.1 oligopeptide ABC transporter substrate-binding protein [Granulicatella elegans]
MKRKWLWLPTAAVALTMAACGSKTTTPTTTTEGADKSKFVSEITHDGEPIKGGTLNYAIVSSSPLKGVFMDELSQDVTDSIVGDMIDAPMFEYDDNRKLVNSGLASISFDVEGKTATVKLNSQDYKWSDGEKVTIDDYIFAYEGIGHKDYTGVRYDRDYENIEGMDEYHNGSASTISGLEKLDDYTVKIHYKEMTPSMQLAGGAVCSFIMPKHVFSKIPVADWEQSDAVRGKSFVGLGAFTIESMVPGESVTMVANPNYFKGRPNIDKLVMEVVSPDSIVSEMKAGKYDIAEMPRAQYDSFKDLTNVTFVSSLESAYEYIGFKLGKWDQEQGKNVLSENPKMGDVALRQAIAYAIDPNTAGKNLYNGLQHGANSIIIPFFKDIYNKDQEGFAYNPEKAKKLLDDAGYKDVDGDGLRENKDGSKLTINFAARKRDDANESLIQQYLLWWKEVGLDVQLYTGRTIEVNSFYEKIQTDDPEIDMFAGGWSTGYDPNPSGLFGEKAKFNLQRYTSAEGNALMEKISSTEAFDNSKNIQFYKEWQKYVHDNAFIFPTITGEKVTAVNKRVKYFDTKLGSNNEKSSMAKLQLTANEPVK